MLPRPVALLAAGLLGTVACASVIGLDAYEVTDAEPDASAGADATVADASKPVVVDARSDTSADVDSGDAGNVLNVEGVVVTPPEVVLEDVPCGVAKSGTFALTNTKSTPVSFEIGVPASNWLTVEGADGGVLEGELAPNTSRSITVSGKDAAVGVRGVDLTIKVGETTVPYGVKLLTRGAKLSVSPATLDFGDIRSNTSASTTVLFKNEGTDPVTITGFGAVGTNFSLNPTNLKVPAGGETPATVSMTPAAAGPPVSVKLTPTLEAPLCGTVPSFELKGHRVDQEVSINPVTLDFGTQSCGPTPPTTTLKVTIQNYLVASATPFTTTLGSGAFKVTPASGTVPAANGTTPGKTELTVSIVDTNGAPGDKNANLDVNITSPITTSTRVALRMSTTGALISLPQTAVTIPNKATVNAVIKNLGNRPICVVYDEASINDRFFGVEAEGDTIEPNVDHDIDVKYDSSGPFVGPPTSGPLPRTATVMIYATGCGGNQPPTPLCAPMPTLAVTGIE